MLRRLREIAAVGAAAALAACATAPLDAPEPPVAPSPADAPAAPKWLITEEGVGPIRLGMTLDELMAAAPGLVLEHEPYFSGEIAEAERVLIDGEAVAYVTLYGTVDCGETPKVDYVFTANAEARTTDGVGPGSLVSDAAVAWGAPTLEISLIESREYADFPDAPRSLSIRTGTPLEDVWRGGVYPNGDDIGESTTEYREDAIITSIEMQAYVGDF